MTSLPSLREVIERHGLWARKTLGQNFLLDLNLTRRIVRAAGVNARSTVYEVGPGPGGLTRALLETRAKVIAIEKDRRAIGAVSELADVYSGQLTVIEGDALKADESALVGHAPYCQCVSNLPYNIATPLLIKWLSSDPWPPWYQSLTLMFQKEVAERIVAAPGGKAYGRLAVLTALRVTAQKLFDIPAQAFLPPPKVTSSVVHLVPRLETADVPISALERVTAAAFGQRRKMLRQSLKNIFQHTDSILEKMKIDPTIRAESLSPDDYLRLARCLQELKER